MEKTFEMHTKRVISYLQAVKQYPNIVVYKDEEFVDGELIQSTQGIANLQHIQSCGKNGLIRSFTKKYAAFNRNQTKYLILARRVEYQEEMRKVGCTNAKPENLGLVNNVYKVIEEDGMLDMDNLEEYAFFYQDVGSDLAESLDEKPVPQAMRFNYMSGNIHNGYYHLDKILDVIKERPDIEWLNREKKAKITAIPFYNSEEGRDQELYFCWIPSNEDYAKLKFDNRWHKELEIFKTIFGIDLSEEGTALKEPNIY